MRAGLVTVAVWAGALAAFDAGAQARPIGFALPSLQGDTIRVGGGAPVTVVAVFASWCRSCRDDVLAINRLTREFAPRGVRVVALSADDGSDERLRAWLVKYHVAYPVVRDTSRATMRALGVVGVPEAYLIGTDGRIVWSRRGPISALLGALRAALRAMLRQQ